MRKTKFQRITAFVLTVFLLLSSGMIAVSAASQSTTGTTTEQLKELLNMISYNEYRDGFKDANIEAGEEIVIDATKGWTFVTSGGKEYSASSELADGDKKSVAHVLGSGADLKGIICDGSEPTDAENKEMESFGDKTGLYTPSAGTVTWDITEQISGAAKYTMKIEYFPISNKSASIERMFKINGSVPFSEARGLTIAKIWKNVYEDGKLELPEGESADTYINAAKDAGIEAWENVEDGVTYIEYKMPEYWTSESAALVNENVLRFFLSDIDENEIRSSLTQEPVWAEYYFKDANGFMQDCFEFVLAPDENGKVTIALESVNEPMAISKITLVPYESEISYEDYLKKYEGVVAGKDTIKMEAEYYSAASSQTIYPIADSTSAITSPVSSEHSTLNTLGGDKWQTSGQWIEYKFKVSSSGMYKIATRFKQNVLDGMYTSRAMYIYSDGLDEGSDGYYNGLPFDEAGRLQFNYSSEWQSGMLTDGVKVPGEKDKEVDRSFDIYFEEGVEYTLRFEVTLGNMGDIVRRVQESLESINADYLNILKLTGSNPDEYRDYGFSRVMPDTKIDLIKQGRELASISAELSEIASVKSSMTATLDKVVRLLELMKDDDEIAKNLEQLKTYIGSLGTWLSDAKTQPLILDYIVVQPADDDTVPVAEAGFFKALWFEIKSFIQSFFRNYSRQGAMTEVNEDESVEVWLAYGRDQSQVIRGLINNGFTPESKVPVDLKLVAGSTLLPSILSGMGPDVYIGLGQNEIINYAIRGALVAVGERELVDGETVYKDIEGFSEFADAASDFDKSAMLTLGIEDADGNFLYYGLPETQNFTMMFVREDIFADLGIEIPKTWDDVKEAIPVLQEKNMQVGMIRDENIFLYQMGGDLFADDGMRINLDSNVALDAFNTMTEMFTMYSFPYQYDFANRFRTGEMPIGFANYTATYNQLKVFATEIEGLWSFYPLPGYADEMTGEINNSSVSTVTATCIVNGCKEPADAWEFVKWYTGDQCQSDYANEMVALLGPSAKHPTANVAALESLPWTDAELTQLKAQFANLAAIPNYPGRYIVERYTQFAFLDAFNDKLDPVTEMQSYIKIINTEITRKRQEFGLETLADGQTLAQKRMSQAEEALNAVAESSAYSSDYSSAHNNALNLIKDYVTEDYASLRSLADTLTELDSELYADAAKYMKQAASALESYEAYK